MTTTPMIRRWVATRDSPKQAATALLRLTLSTPRLWIAIAGVELMFAFLLGLLMDGPYGIATRLWIGSVFALAPTLAVVVMVLALSYLPYRLKFRQRLREGAVLEAGVGERSLLLRGPWAETTLSFDGLESVRASGDWVFLQQKGSPVLSAWPTELFPPAELARLERTVHLHSS